jgi:hypothetical protein
MWLEFDITYVCGMGCHNCNRMTQLVPGRSEENFRLDQSAHCRFETPGLSLAQWFLVGGEPTAHPDLEPIVRRFGQYRDRRGPGAFQVGLATHGHGSATQRRLRELQREFPFLHVLNSRKTRPSHPGFVASCVAPIDRTPEALAGHRFGGCNISWHCGVSMNFAGFYCCAVAGAIDRIRGVLNV